MLTVGGRTIELLATPGGETTDSMVVWLPEEQICLCGNIFGPVFGHIPNLVTMRGDRYRDALTDHRHRSSGSASCGRKS